MRVAVRTACVVILALIGAVLMALTWTATSIVALAANTTALIMGGSGDPLTIEKDGLPFIRQYMGTSIDNYIRPSSTATPDTGIPEGPYNAVALITPAQFYPNGELTFDQSVAQGKANLHTCIASADCEYDVGSATPTADDTFVAFGFSQSATIATLEKRSLADQYAVGEGPTVSFVLTANGNRPNGGYLARGPQGFTIPTFLPGGGVTFSGPTPTDTQYKTVDIAMQYDGWADSPVNPLNLLAVANANMGQQYLHPHYSDHSLTEPGVVNQGQYGDTTYYMIPTAILPLLTPVDQIPVIGHALADTLDAPLRVLVEAGYDRTTSPGQPTPWNPLYSPDPIAVAVNVAVAIPTGLDNGFEDLSGIRPFGTQRPGPYGVGGPDVTYLNPPATTATNQPAAPTNPSLLSSPARSAASVNPDDPDDGSREVQPTAEHSEAAAAGQSSHAPNNDVSVDGSTTVPSRLASANDPADASAPAPESMKEPDITLASKPATQAEDRAPAVKFDGTTRAPQRGNGADSFATTSPTPSLAVATKPTQPRLRQPIDANAPGPTATSASADAPVSKVPAGSTDDQNATSSDPSNSASSHPSDSEQSSR
jgi:hypothetical protein